jgi:hypothetical protein
LPSKILLANFIVRIYRLERKKPRGVVGFVEEPGVKGKKAFTNFDELWEILTSSKAIKSKKIGVGKGSGRKKFFQGMITKEERR